jgi:hypothetical protein
MATVWFVLGDVSAQEGYLSLFRPPELPRSLELVLAVVLTVTIGVKLVAVRRLHVQGLLAMVLLAMAIGAYVGFTLRVLSSLTVGANIGGGLLMLAAPFVLVPLAIATVICGRIAVNAPADGD